MAQPLRNSAQWVALRLLAYLGITSLIDAPAATDSTASSATYLTPGLLDDIAGLETAALAQIALDGPAFLSETPLGLSVFAPTTVTLNVTQGSAAAQIVSGVQPWMQGCTVAIAGDGFQNEFVNATGRLARPYLGPTAQNVAATVFGNAVPLPVNVKNVLGPVILGGRGELSPCVSRAQFDEASGRGWHCGWGNLIQNWPRCYFVETTFDDDLPYPVQILRIAPSPLAPSPLTARARINVPTIQTADLGTDDIDPGYLLPGVAGAHTETIFLPYCLQLLTGHPLWKPDNPNAAAEIARRFQLAKSQLREFRGQREGSIGGYAYNGGEITSRWR